jgi:Dioxygenase
MQTSLKRVLGGAIVAGALLGAALVPSVAAQTLPGAPAPAQPAGPRGPRPALAAPTTSDQSGLTASQTEGPYYKAGSPEASNLLQEGMPGTPLTITGQVLDANGNPVANAWLDFWQADANGNYDNSGYTLRGHQYTDANGYYTLTTIVPGLYTGRTEHIHVKVQAPNGPVLTTQLYFPGVAQNARDGIFDSSLLLNIVDNGDGTQSGTFNFVVATA